MRLRGIVALAAGAALATACGSEMMSGTSSGATTMQEFQAIGSDVSATVEDYQADTTTIPDDAACQSTHDAYHAQMEEMLARMAEMSAAMDRHMGDYGNAVPGDTQCAAAVMAAELERHHAAACTADVTRDEAEAAHHVGAMTSMLEHQRLRYESAGAMMGMMGGTAGATTWACQQNEDGTFTINGEPWTPGTPLPPAADDGSAPWPAPCTGDGCSGCDGPGRMGDGMM